MVGHDSNVSKNLNSFDYTLAGASSGCLTRMLCQPLDVLKIRFQLQVEPVSKKALAKYRSLPQAVISIVHEEGIKSLWKGHVSGQLLSITYGVGQFVSFEALTKEANKLNLSPKLTPVINFACGATAGGVATLLSFPFDVVRTRLVAQSEINKVYSGVPDAFINMYRKEGFFVFYRGIWPTFLQVAPHTGIQFMCYKIFNNMYKQALGSDNTTLGSSLVSGSLAGLCAKTAIYPLDLVKKRMQIQGFEENRREFGAVFKCEGFKDCCKRIFRREGIPGFFKGLSPSLIKAILATALHFSSYEMICKALDKRKSRSS